MNDPGRLRDRNFRSQFELLGELNIDPSSFYRDLRADRVSARNLDRLVGALATAAEAAAFGELLSAPHSRRMREDRSLASLLNRAIDDGPYWDREFRYLRMSYGIFNERPDISDLYGICERAVAAPRSDGDYATAMRNGLILSQWFLNRSRDRVEDLVASGTFLLALGNAAGRAEHLPMHRRSLRLGRLFLNRKSRCLFMERLVQDTVGQLLYNGGPENRTILKKALRVHDEELKTADEILRGYSHPVDDCLLVVGESYYNRLSILVKLGISAQSFDREYARLEHNINELSVSLPREKGGAPELNIGRDVGDFMKLLRIRQYLAENRLFTAAEHAEQLIAEVRGAGRETTFLGAYANYWAGLLKRRRASDRCSASQAEEIRQHANAARQAFR
jgi:hypothetical protein